MPESDNIHFAIFPEPAKTFPSNAREQAELDNVIQAIKTIFDWYGIPSTQDNHDQFRVFLKALQVYAGRTVAYGQVWKQYGALANLLSAARKVDRLMSIWWHHDEEYVGPKAGIRMHKDSLDDAVDGLNYLVFFMRLKGTNVTGEEPARPTLPPQPR